MAVEGHAGAFGKPDPNLQLPAAVRSAAERAEALATQAREAAHRAAQTGQDQPFAPPVAPQSNSTTVVASFDPANPRPPDPTSLSPAPDSGPPNWEHQFNSMRGRYERAEQDNRRMATQINDMQRLMAAMHTPPPSPAPPQAQQGSGVRFEGGVSGGRKLTPKEISEYGEELLDVVGRRAQEMYEPVVAGLRNELEQVRRQVGGVQNSVVYDARVKMYDDLAKEVPNWSTVNTSPEFADWLAQPDPLTGVVRKNILTHAHNSNQTGRVVAAFKSFLADQASFGPANGGAAPGNGAGNPAPTPHVDLAQFAAPGRAKPGQTQVPPEKPYFSRADVAQFYREKTLGRYAGREAEAAQLEAQIIEAGREGRVR